MGSGTLTINGHNGWQYGTNSWLSNYGTNYDLTLGKNVQYGYYQPYVMKFTTPSFSGVSTSISFKFALQYRNTTSPSVRWAVCTSDANRDMYRDTHSAVADPTQLITGTKTWSIKGSGATYNNDLTINTTSLKGSTTYYLYMWAVNTTGFTAMLNSAAKATGTINYTSAYTLTISQGTGSSITVNRTSSSYGSTGKLSNGATLFPSDSLTITIAANTGYNLTAQSHTSGSTVTVSGNLTVSATASVLSYKLSISAGANSTITVNRTSSPKQGASTGNLSSGATIYYSDVLKITFGASSGYEVETHTVNNSTFTSGNSHTVTGAVSVASTAKALGLVYIYNGTTYEAYMIFIHDGTNWNQYAPYIHDGTSYNMYS